MPRGVLVKDDGWYVGCQNNCNGKMRVFEGSPIGQKLIKWLCQAIV